MYKIQFESQSRKQQRSLLKPRHLLIEKIHSFKNSHINAVFQLKLAVFKAQRIQTHSNELIRSKFSDRRAQYFLRCILHLSDVDNARIVNSLTEF